MLLRVLARLVDARKNEISIARRRIIHFLWTARHAEQHDTV